MGGSSLSWRCPCSAGISMYNFLHSYRVVLLGGFLLSTLLTGTAKADQIVVLVDDQGHKIYVNTGETASRVDWMASSFRPDQSAASAIGPADINKLVEQSASRFQVDPDLV